MTRKFKFLMFTLMILGQVIVYRYFHQLHLNLDFLYLILVYYTVNTTFYKSIAAASIIGLITDYLSGGVMGVFGFSRTLAAFLLNDFSRRIDLKNNLFVFLLIAVSMAFSNGVAYIFFYIISGEPFNISLVVYQPLLTGLVGVVTVTFTKSRTYLDVY